MTISSNGFDSHEADGAVSATSTAAEAESESHDVETDTDPIPRKRDKVRRSTSHLKAVPETLPHRERLKSAAERYSETLDKSQPFSKDDLETHGRKLLAELGEPEKFLGFTMVMIGNFFWKQQFLTIPFHRRMLLLPHCLKHAAGCPADYDEFGLDCEKCGACSIADYKVRAEQLGYKVLVAEGSPIVLKIIVSGHIDGILGVACLNVLEKAIDKVLIAGVPSYAVPLHSGDCKSTTLDESWVWDVLEKYEEPKGPAAAPTSSYVPLMRGANELFDVHFDRLLPRVRSKGVPADLDSALSATEAIAYDWLQHGGKRFRPFITLAAYDAARGGLAAAAGPGAAAQSFPDNVSRVAMAIEAFHKASLVHDDIEDDDLYRYGRETLHRRFGLGTAINVGDHLIGLGYRLVTSIRAEAGADAAADIADRMAAAHVKLCDGQGAEMHWHEAPGQMLRPIDALQIYALKTSPAFEAALYAGLRLAGPIAPYEEMIPVFTRHLGVGFQILNDLKDWQGDDNNKLVAGQDALSLRPTLLLALAFEAAAPSQRAELDAIVADHGSEALRTGRLRRIFEECGVFDKAQALVEKSRARAEALADEVQPDSLRQLLYFLVDMVLAPETEEPAIAAANSPLVSLSVVSAT
ncbi:MAG TPA: polyprenyl synthetase family protein [Planctomycetaceae bacterium]